MEESGGVLIGLVEKLEGSNWEYKRGIEKYFRCESGNLSIRRADESVNIYGMDLLDRTVEIQRLSINYFAKRSGFERQLMVTLEFINQAKNYAFLEMTRCCSQIPLPTLKEEQRKNPVLRAMHAFRDRLSDYEGEGFIYAALKMFPEKLDGEKDKKALQLIVQYFGQYETRVSSMDTTLPV